MNNSPDDLSDKLFSLTLKDDSILSDLIVTGINCEAVKSSQLKEKIEVKGDQIYYIHCSINGWKEKKQKFKDFLENYFESTPNVICLSKINKIGMGIELDGYSSFVTRPVGAQGGSAILVKKTSDQLKDLNEKGEKATKKDWQLKNCDTESVWIEIKRRRDNKEVVIGSINRHYKADFSKFCKELEKVISKIKNKCFYVFGIINVDLLKDNEKKKLYCDILGKNNCKLLITRATHEQGKATLTDHIFTNDDISADSLSGVVRDFQCLFDHLPIFCIV